MTAAFDDAVATLFQSALGDFVQERKRLSTELKASGDQAGAAKLSKLPRPPISAWAVNQLWWQQREAFDALLDAAARVKAGEREASKEHRQALAELREHAAAVLDRAGNAASEVTLRRITTTLSALAATGGFEPDPPGALVADRDPPGFETFVAGAAEPRAEPTSESGSRKNDEEAAKRRAEEEEERKRRAAERERLSAMLRDARQVHGEQQREVTRLRGELETAEQSLKQTQALLAEIEAKLTNL